MNGIPVLMYHALETEEKQSGYSCRGEQMYVLKRDHFHDQMKLLYENGYKSLFINETLNMSSIPPMSVIITFDDGHSSNEQLALPILQEYGFKAEFFITTGWIGLPNFLDTIQIKRLVSAGMKIGSHGVSHAFLNDLDENDLWGELTGSKKVLEDIVGGKIDSISLPGGRVPGSANRIAEAGFGVSCTSEVGIFNGHDSYFIPRIAIRNAVSSQEYLRIISGNQMYYYKEAFRNKLLRNSKTIFGNRIYQSIRSYILNRDLCK